LHDIDYVIARASERQVPDVQRSRGGVTSGGCRRLENSILAARRRRRRRATSRRNVKAKLVSSEVQGGERGGMKKLRELPTAIRRLEFRAIRGSALLLAFSTRVPRE